MKTLNAKNAVRCVLAVASLSSLIGCRVPGGSFATEPLQHRFAEMARVNAEASDGIVRDIDQVAYQPRATSRSLASLDKRAAF